MADNTLGGRKYNKTLPDKEIIPEATTPKKDSSKLFFEEMVDGFDVSKGLQSIQKPAVPTFKESVIIDNLQSIVDEVRDEVIKEEPVTVKEEFKLTVKRSEKTPTEMLKAQNELLSIEVIKDEDYAKKYLERTLDKTFKHTATKQVVLPKSNYVAYLRALTWNELDVIRTSELGLEAGRQQLYETIYNATMETNVKAPGLKKISLDQFMNITAKDDLQTLIFALYMRTYPGVIKLPIKCLNDVDNIDPSTGNKNLETPKVKCNHDNKFEFSAETFITIKDEEIYDNTNEILHSLKTPEELLQDAIVNKITRVKLTLSNIIVDLSIPTLKKELDTFHLINPVDLEKYENLIDLLMYINAIFIPEQDENETANEKFFKITDPEEIYRILTSMLYDDDRHEIEKTRDELNKKLLITYKTPKATCDKCKNDIPELVTSPEELLFRKLYRLEDRL